MTQEEKQLLLADICARLPYGVMAIPIEGVGFKPTEVTSITTDVMGSKVTLDGCLVLPINMVALYLRPMSSMTEEERLELYAALIYANMIDNTRAQIDWFNAHHFDYRGLIQKGLAISTEEFNPYED